MMDALMDGERVIGSVDEKNPFYMVYLIGYIGLISVEPRQQTNLVTLYRLQY